MGTFLIILPNAFSVKACCEDSECAPGVCSGADCASGIQGSCTAGEECGTGGGGAQCGTCYTCSGGSCIPDGTCTGGTCFPAGTKVTLPNNKTENIEDVKVGDKVVSEDETGKQSVSTVQAVEKPVSNNLCDIKYTDGEDLKVTKGHPLFTQNGWKAIDINVAAQEDPGVPVSTLNIGDFMKKDTGSWDQIANISCKDETVQTYNLTVDNAHTYFAGGFLAHNKGWTCPGCYPGTYGVHYVDNLTATQADSTSVDLNWTFSIGEGRCSNQNNSHTDIFVGRSEESVNNNCGVPAGTSTDQTWPDVDYTPNGGAGGGGNGATNALLGSPGANGLGGGGGGSGDLGTDTDSAGGSGIVIVSYPTGSLAATGGTTTSSGGYTTHTFTTSGTFTVTSGSTSSARILVVAGGAAGGSYGGGGGAGGTIYQDNHSLSSKSYNVVVGSGGVGLNWYICRQCNDRDRCTNQICGSGQSNPGQDSSFDTINATGGGGAGSNTLKCNSKYTYCSWSNPAGLDGGSGGGGGQSTWYGTTAGGSGIPGQGSNGGITDGGGGGRSQAGLDGVYDMAGGKGGDGLTTDISGVITAYGGGGGGFTAGDAPPGCYQLRVIQGASNNSYTITNLAPGVKYYFKVITVFDDYDNRDGSYLGYYCDGTGSVSSSACSVTYSPSSPISLPQGQTTSFTTTVTGITGTQTVKYLSSAFFHFDPNSVTQDVANLYSNTLYADQQTTGSEPFTVGVYTNPTDTSAQCTTTGTIAVTPPENPWWQVKDSDVQANGDLKSSVPTGEVFGDIGAGGFPGVPASTNAPDFGTGIVSQVGWVAQSTWLNPRNFNYDYLYNLIPSDTLQNIKSLGSNEAPSGATPDSQGYEWYKYDGSANGGIPYALDNPIDFGSRKVILFIDSADFDINSTINLTKGSGFFLVVVKGNIVVAPTVGGTTNDLEGLYLANGTFSDGTNSASDDPQLHVRGSVAANGVSLDRVPTDNSSPAELFEYAPDQIMLYPAVLGYRKINWKEIAP